jgi:heme-degrading monooxygenase HmoA
MSGPFLANTPEPPYFAVIFTNWRTDADPEGYGRTAERMVELAAEVPGFLGIESVRDAAGCGVTVSYWATEEAIAEWGRHAEHRLAQAGGRERWYAGFRLRVARVTEERRFGA